MSKKELNFVMDFGHANVKGIAIHKEHQQKPYSLNSVYSAEQPEPITRKGAKVAVKSFPVTSLGQTYWYGQGVLSSSQAIRYMFGTRHDAEHIQKLFNGWLANWKKLTKTPHEAIHNATINIWAMLPAENYTIEKDRNLAAKAYQKAFSNFVLNWTIGSHHRVNKGVKSEFKIRPIFKTLQPESLDYAFSQSIKGKYLVVLDIGFGTATFIVRERGNPDPLINVSLPNGVAYGLAENINSKEFAIYRKEAKASQLLESYHAKLLARMTMLMNEYGLNKTEGHIIGGGVHGLNRSQWRKVGNRGSIVFGNEFSNVLATADKLGGKV